jgi:dCMP deaminase
MYKIFDKFIKMLDEIVYGKEPDFLEIEKINNIKNKENQSKWDKRYVLLAKHISSWSKDQSTQVGAVIFDAKQRLVSVGYNGFPRGIEDKNELLENRETKYKIIVHAEINSILFSNKDLKGCSLATWPFMPCSDCCKTIIQTGIKRVIAPYNDNPRWKDSFKLSESLFKEAGIDLLLLNDLI